MHWSKLKQQIEGRFAKTIAGRVELRLTSYRHAHDGHGRAWITIDGTEVASMCYWRSLREGAYEPEAGLVKMFFEDESGKMREAPFVPQYSGVMSPHVFTQTLIRYLSLSIDEALASKNFLTRALAILDHRVGKRRLAAIRLASDEHDLVRRILQLRCEVENITPQSR